jgi:hypothetical protein
MGNAYKCFVGKSEDRCRLRDLGIGGRIILKWIFKEIGRENVAWIQLAQDRVQWWTLLNTIMNLRVRKKTVNFLNI